jgi:SAM-dependent methyltransferase
VSRAADFPWPTPPGVAGPPAWDGRGFVVAGRPVPVLDFRPDVTGWTDSLTDLHEQLDGDGRHFIDRASRSRAVAELRRHAPGPAPTLLEVGCSSGHLLGDLVAAFPGSRVIGADAVPGPLARLAGTLPVPLLCFDLVRCPLPDACVDAVVLLNVLEHIADDAAALAQVRRVLRPGGVAVLEVPAGPGLYDVYDKFLRHHRRYRLAGLLGLVRGAGLTVLRASHLGCLLYPAFWWAKRRNRRWLDRPQEEQAAVVRRAITGTRDSRLGTALMAAELGLGRWLRYPFGVRCVVTAQREG